jgi:hypothetical protein
VSSEKDLELALELAPRPRLGSPGKGQLKSFEHTNPSFSMAGISQPLLNIARGAGVDAIARSDAQAGEVL